jgi:hypothetical protein
MIVDRRSLLSVVKISLNYAFQILKEDNISLASWESLCLLLINPTLDIPRIIDKDLAAPLKPDARFAATSFQSR